jgi:hypothetical protein
MPRSSLSASTSEVFSKSWRKERARASSTKSVWNKLTLCLKGDDAETGLFFWLLLISSMIKSQ